MAVLKLMCVFIAFCSIDNALAGKRIIAVILACFTLRLIKYLVITQIKIILIEFTAK